MVIKIINWKVESGNHKNQENYSGEYDKKKK